MILPLSTLFTVFLAPIVFHLVPIANAVLVNVTVDDTFPDPLTGRSVAYLPEGNQWKNGTNCSDCTAAIDRQFMYNQTWHDGTYFPDTSGGPLNATLTFNGTSIYVFCALSQSTGFPDGYSNMTFYIDDEWVGRFERQPAGIKNTFLYNISVYSNTSLSPGEHKIMLQNGQYGKQGNNSLVLLDYMVYSYDDGEPLPPEPSSTPDTSNSRRRRELRTPAVVGIAVGVTAAVTALGAIIWILRRRRRKYHSVDNQSFNLDSEYDDIVVPDPFITPSNATLPSMHQQRDVDAGPLEVAEERHEPLLPPDYGQVFTGSTPAPTPSRPQRKV